MSTDRELLEAAARAAGMEPRFYLDDASGWWCAQEDGSGDYWNPLDFDCEALGLAVKLEMSVEISAHEASTYAYAGKVPRASAWEHWRDDPRAATRRAIVRAAAACAPQPKE